ncbi:alpha/beta hydrolase [Pseudomonas sp. RIT-PI-AD]|uniref:alpha/beta hydrolase n=1 Tax=Pseudomonas sp. RIT-PI-AD TaxID=3035294 RepID=UPI0021D91912|nr:alpha/beta hydrolase [Pseudomonas sp. RIT-PI-AD]
MPEPFQPDELRSLLRPLATAADELAQNHRYRTFYGLDFAERHPGVRTRLGHFVVKDFRLAVQLWTPPQPRASLLLLHGYYDHMGLYRHVIDWALGRGFAVLACDLPGHGLSSGVRASIEDFADYQATLAGLLAEAEALNLPAPWHLCGQSTGGAILLDHLLTGAPDPRLGETVLLAPLVRPRAWNWSRLSYRLLRPFVESIPRRFSVNSGDAAFIDFVHREDPLQPQTLPTAWVGALSRWIPRIEAAPRSARRPLIVQGDADMTVDWQHNLGVLRDKFDRPEVLILPQAQHHLANEVEAIRRRYFAFLDERID